MSAVRVGAVMLTVAVAVAVAGCSATVPDPPGTVGDGYPGTCLPGELSWPTDFLESLPGESSAIGGRIVGLRLEYVDSEWVWRLRSADTRYDVFGEQTDDPAFGKESVVDVRTLENLASQQIELTPAEQQTGGIGAYEAAQLSGEEWPSPLIIEMARVMDAGEAVWRITTCDTATGDHTVTLLP